MLNIFQMESTKGKQDEKGKLNKFLINPPLRWRCPYFRRWRTSGNWKSLLLPFPRVSSDRIHWKRKEWGKKRASRTHFGHKIELEAEPQTGEWKNNFSNGFFPFQRVGRFEGQKLHKLGCRVRPWRTVFIMKPLPIIGCLKTSQKM